MFKGQTLQFKGLKPLRAAAAAKSGVDNTDLGRTKEKAASKENVHS